MKKGVTLFDQSNFSLLWLESYAHRNAREESSEFQTCRWKDTFGVDVPTETKSHGRISTFLVPASQPASTRLSEINMR